MTNSTLKLTSDQAQLLSQMFGDLASLDYDDKYNDDFGSDVFNQLWDKVTNCLLYTSPSPRDQRGSRMPSSA